jgi:SAM-dependent methyltransferase
MSLPAATGDVAFEDVRCLCGADADARIREAWCDVTGEKFTYRRCRACGLDRLSPRPLPQFMGRYYPDTYAPFNDPELARHSRRERFKRLLYEIFHAAPSERSAFVQRWRALLWLPTYPLRHHPVLSFTAPPQRSVFELGAGSGNDLVEFRDAGWTVAGCEPSAHACGVAASRSIVLQQCTAEEAIIPEGIGCVYMNNVFEHLHDPEQVLRNAHHALIDGGLVVLIVPNHASAAARLFGAAWPGYDAPKHIWGFTAGSIRNLLQRTGFERIEVHQKFPFSRYCWSTGLSGTRLPQSRWSGLRRRAERIFRRGLVGFGLAACTLGYGDYLHVVAHKTGR